jgi:hypothetical protein
LRVPSKCSCYVFLGLLLSALVTFSSKAGQPVSTDPIPTYIFGRADFLVGNQPVAIAAGDFNGDGQLDLVVANQADNAVSILLGKPDGTFASHVDYPTGPVPSAVIVGDFNADGNLDIAVVNQNCTVQGIRQPILACGQGSVSILLGNGDGSFQAHTEYNAGTQPMAIAAGDFNGDGNLDLAVANANYCETFGPVISSCAPGGVSVLLGNGSGGFESQVSYATPGGAFSVVVADFNGDHKLDIAVAGGGPSSPGRVSLLFGNGDGTFQSHIDSTLGTTNGLSLAAGDFNGDGKTDLAVGGSEFLDIMIGNGDGTFLYKEHYNGGNVVIAADFNGDGKIDLAVPYQTNAFGKYSTAVLLGNGDGTFQTAVQYSSGINPQTLIAADLNGDGKLDLAVACAGGGQTGLSGSVAVLLGFGDGTFPAANLIGTGSAAITSTDLNGDGKLDIAIPGSLFLGNGDGTFQTVNPGNYVPDRTADFVAAADFNGDGKTDVAVVNLLCPSGSICNPGSVSIFLGTGDFSNNSPGPFQPRVDYAVGVMPNMLIIGDFNGDGKPDLAVANGSSYPSGSVSVLLGKGDGTFQSQIVYPLPGANWIASGDFNGDGKLDLAIVTNFTVSIALGNGDGTFQHKVDYPFGAVDGAGTITVGDFNHDGKLDLAVTRALASTVQGVVSVFLGNGDGTFQAPVDYPTASLGSALVQTVDVNGDGKLDLLVGAYNVPNPFSILIGNGDGTFRLPVTYLVPDGSDVPFTVGDFNQDGVPDVASVGFDGSVDVLLSAAFKSVSPSVLSFDPQGLGTTSPAQAITISNSTNVPFTISGITASASFGSTNNCGSVMQPGTSCIVTVKFSPSATGMQAGTLTITDSTRSSPENVPLTGTAVNGPALSSYPGRLTFSSQLVGATSSPLAVQLVNTGNASLTLNSISMTGANGSDFAQTNNCGSSLAAGTSCTANITFTPGGAGLRTGNLSVSDTETGSLQAIPVFGSGSDFQISAASFSPASITLGGSATSTITITALGGFTGSVNLSCSAGLASGVTCGFDPASVIAATDGIATSTLTINTVQGASPLAYMITVTGTSAGLSHSALPQGLTVQAAQPPGFALAPTTSGSASVTAGQTTSFALAATSVAGFSGTVNIICSVSPTPAFAPTCSVPSTVQVDANTPAAFSVAVATTVSTSAELRIREELGSSPHWAVVSSAGLFVLGIALLPVRMSTNLRRRSKLFCVGLLLCALGALGCGGGGGSGGGGASRTPSGAYAITVTGTSGTVSQTSTLKLTVQ